MLAGTRDRHWRLLAASMLLLVLAGGTGCGRTDFDTGTSGGGGGTMPGGIPQLPATPGLFVCGSGICLTSSQQCCLGLSSGDALSASCMPLSASCPGVSLQCDEPGDCGGAANVCCLGLGAGGSASGVALGSQCVAASRCAGTGHLVVCRQDSDCHGSGVCCAGEGLPTCLATCPKI